jgi:hypothetical protein
MSKKFARTAAIACLCLVLPGCSTLKDALFPRESRLAPLENAVLGQTTREDIIQRVGFPIEIDKRWFDGFETEVFFYYDESMSETAAGGIRHKFLVCEFRKGVLNGYAYHEYGSAGSQNFDQKKRSQLVEGETTRREVQALLGAPPARARLPTGFTLPALELRIAGVPFPMAQIPQGAEEIWQYYRRDLDEDLRTTGQQSLSVFFDGKGVVIGSTLLQELLGSGH